MTTQIAMKQILPNQGILNEQIFISPMRNPATSPVAKPPEGSPFQNRGSFLSLSVFITPI